MCTDPLTEAAAAIIRQHPGTTARRAYQLAMQDNPQLAESWHNTPDGSVAAPSNAGMVDPGAVLMQYAAAAGTDFRAACAAHPVLADAYHRAELVLAASALLPPPGPIIAHFRATVNAAMRAVPVFATGVWNGRKYSTADLQSMVRAFESSHFQVPLSLGHDARPDAPAVGRVSRLWIDGSRLLADFSDVAPEVMTGIREGKWLSLSCEVYLDLSRNGEKYPAALRSIAILGAHVPGVDLPNLRSALA